MTRFEDDFGFERREPLFPDEREGLRIIQIDDPLEIKKIPRINENNPFELIGKRNEADSWPDIPSIRDSELSPSSSAVLRARKAVEDAKLDLYDAQLSVEDAKSKLERARIHLSSLTLGFKYPQGIGTPEPELPTLKNTHEILHFDIPKPNEEKPLTTIWDLLKPKDKKEKD